MQLLIISLFSDVIISSSLIVAFGAAGRTPYVFPKGTTGLFLRGILLAVFIVVVMMVLSCLLL